VAPAGRHVSLRGAEGPTGHDLYQLSLHRLENWEKRYPGRLRDVTTFGRAEALERLREYEKAADFYGQVAKSPPRSRTAPATTPNARRPSPPPRRCRRAAPDLDATLDALRRKLDAWSKLVARYAATPHEATALTEEERLEKAAARLVVAHRRDLTDGNAVAERSLRFLIEKHADSKNSPTTSSGSATSTPPSPATTSTSTSVRSRSTEASSPPGRPRPRRVPQGRDVGRLAREAGGAGALRGARRVQDGGARTLSVSTG
jgi:hypothetical protein